MRQKQTIAFIYLFQYSAGRMISGWWVVRLTMKEGWRCVEMRSGVPYVTTTGLLRMLVWHADNSDIPGIVCNMYSMMLDVM